MAHPCGETPIALHSVARTVSHQIPAESPCPSFPCFLEKGTENPPKKQGFFIPTEPLKSLEKKGKTLEKTRNSSQGKKNKEFQKNKARKDRAEMSHQNRATPPQIKVSHLSPDPPSQAWGPRRRGGCPGGLVEGIATLLGSGNGSRYRGVSQLQSHQSRYSVQPKPPPPLPNQTSLGK